MRPKKNKENNNVAYCQRYRQKIQLKRLQSKAFDKKYRKYAAMGHANKVMHMSIRFSFRKRSVSNMATMKKNFSQKFYFVKKSQTLHILPDLYFS